MFEFLSFITNQIGNLISFLDSFEIIENLSLLRLFIIVILFKMSIKFLYPHKGSDS